MPHSGFGATLNPDPLRKFDPPPKFFFFRHSKFFLLNNLLGFPLMSIYGSGHGPSVVVYHALRNFFQIEQIISLLLIFVLDVLKLWSSLATSKSHDTATCNILPYYLSSTEKHTLNGCHTRQIILVVFFVEQIFLISRQIDIKLLFKGRGSF